MWVYYVVVYVELCCVVLCYVCKYVMYVRILCYVCMYGLYVYRYGMYVCYVTYVMLGLSVCAYVICLCMSEVIFDVMRVGFEC